MDDDFRVKVSNIRKRNPSYEADAYTFLMECFRYTSGKRRQTADRHLKAADICEAVKSNALETFGPMAATVLEEWGIKSACDIGEMVRNLVDEKILIREENDAYEAFEGVFDFHESFVKPYEPE